MIQNILRHLGGIENYGIISLCLFFGVFIGALAWSLFQKRTFCDKMSALPLQDEGIAGDFSGKENHAHE